ncbi:hypothetical protein [Sphingomonas faeni]|uniref:hypothetical protein n=1 Tax=Sphingomonas faeni TaxID=185950 RepID=UPI0033589DFB
MSIPEAFAGVAVAFSAAGLGPYHASIARWPGTPIYDDGGSILTPGTPIARPCMCQVDAVDEKMRAQDGYVDKDVALLVLVATLAGALNTNATIEVTAGPNAGSYSVQSVSKDSMGSHWLCRGRAA